MLDFGGDPLQRLASGTDLKLLWVIVTLAILTSCCEFHPLTSNQCSHPINSDLKISKLSYGGKVRPFILTGCADGPRPEGLPVILAFHGGGESLHNNRGTGFLDFTALGEVHALVVTPKGQTSWNGHTWHNAFPWLKPDPDDDRRMIEALVAELTTLPGIPPIDSRRVFAIGKSDGAGMALSLACQPSNKFHLAGVAAISGAYFGLGLSDRFAKDDSSICLPTSPLPLLLIHGKNDRVMPFEGQKFTNPKALLHASDFWLSKDPGVTVGENHTVKADVDAYAKAIAAGPQKCTKPIVKRFNRFSTRVDLHSILTL